MKKFYKASILIFIVVLLTATACTISISNTPAADQNATAVAGTLTALPQVPTAIPVVPSATTAPIVPTVVVPTSVPPAVGTAVSCGRLSFTLDPQLAAGASCETVPETNEADMPYFAINPEYIHVTLTGYLLPNTFHQPQLFLYPVQRYSELAPDVVPSRITQLHSLIGGNAPSGGLPFPPVFNAGQEFFAQYQLVNFSNGKGIRYITQYSQSGMPINNHELFFTFQGLTNDNAYWLSVLLPVSNSILPPTGDPLPGGVDFETWSNNFNSYIADIKTQLNAQAPASFSPSLVLFDALVSSITVTP
jgi:hypothetical protein